MSRPDPIEYAERLYGAIRAANFSPMSFLAFGNAIKEGVAMRSMPRIAAEPFMRIVGEMLDLEEETCAEVIDADVTVATGNGPLLPSGLPEKDQVAANQPPPSEGVVPSEKPLDSSRPDRAHTGKQKHSR